MNDIGLPPNLIGGGIENYRQVEELPAENSKETVSRLESVGQEFEGVFLSLMLKEMRNTLDGGGFFGEESSDTYGGMFDMFMGKQLAMTSPLGIAEILLDNYSKNQSSSRDPSVEFSHSNESQTNNVSAPGISIVI